MADMVFWSILSTLFPSVLMVLVLATVIAFMADTMNRVLWPVRRD